MRASEMLFYVVYMAFVNSLRLFLCLLRTFRIRHVILHELFIFCNFNGEMTFYNVCSNACLKKCHLTSCFRYSRFPDVISFVLLALAISEVWFYMCFWHFSMEKRDAFWKSCSTNVVPVQGEPCATRPRFLRGSGGTSEGEGPRSNTISV